MRPHRPSVGAAEHNEPQSVLDHGLYLGKTPRYVRVARNGDHSVGRDTRNPVDVVDVRARYRTRWSSPPANDGTRITREGRVGAQRGDDFAETEDVGVEVEADSGLSHAASGAARDVS